MISIEERGTLLSRELRELYAAIEKAKEQHVRVLKEILPSSLEGSEDHLDPSMGQILQRIRMTKRRPRAGRQSSEMG